MKGDPRNPGPLHYRPPALVDWTIRERLALATAVLNCPDQNWATISRMVKRFASEKREEDYFAPRHCARQYAALIERSDQPKRRGEAAQYDCSPEELLVKMLTLDRIEELQEEVKRTQELYRRTKSEIKDIEAGQVDKRQLTRMYAELKEKEKNEPPSEELIQVSEQDLERLKSTPPADDAPTKDAVLAEPVIHCSQLGVSQDEDYEEEAARLEESRRNVLRTLVGSTEVKKEVDEVEEDDADTEEGNEEEEEEKGEEGEESAAGKAITAPAVDIKEENVSDSDAATGTAAGNTEELRGRAISPDSSSFSSTPRRRALPLRPSSGPDDESEDDDETEGDDDDGESRASLKVNEKSYRTWKKSIHMIIRAAQSHKHASVFLSPVTDDIANGYSQVVYRPMDLSTIKRRVDNGEIRCTSEFQRDVMLMFTNAVMYNNAEHDVHKMALEMYDDVMAHIEQYLSTQVMSPNVESKVLRRRVSDQHEEDLPTGRRRRGSADSKEEPAERKKSRK